MNLSSNLINRYILRYIDLHKTRSSQTDIKIMYTTINETGQLNNYATEPAMYLADYPAPEQQRRYLLQGGLATLLISALTFTALVVS